MSRLLPLFAFGLLGFASGPAFAQYCTGTCQTVPACTQGATTTISGTVYAPNGNDPLPNVTVYVAGDVVGAMPAGVSCPVPGAVPSGSPVAGTVTATDGTFTITGVPVNPPGQPQALVITTGKWRRIVPIDLSAGACTNTAIDPTLTRFPRNQSEGDIPKFAIATGEADPVECVLLKVFGGDSTEFTNPGGTGRINFFLAEGSKLADAGSYVGSPGTTPSASTLMGDPTTLGQYDVLMLPCEGEANTSTRQAANTSRGELANLVTFANSGGRVYASHFSYDWLNEAQTFPNVVNWAPAQATPSDQSAIINTGFADGSTLSQWLTLPSVAASTVAGQLPLQTLRHDFNGVNAPTQSWMALNDPSHGNAVMQFTFDTPVGQTTGQCGRVLFNEYHVESAISNTYNKQFPAVCGTATSMSPQEKLLEYMLFNLTSDGGDPTLTPASADFGTQPIGFSTGSANFTWTNNSIFNSAVTLLTATGDFAVGPNQCTSVPAHGTCNIAVTFKPTALGARAGTLTVGGGGKTLTAALTGTGVPALVASTTTMTFGSVDVSASATQTFVLTNAASGPVPVPTVSTSGDFAGAALNCGSSLPAGGTCVIQVTFRPTSTGTRTGSLSFNSQYTSSVLAISGNGVDFALALSSPSGTVIAGRGLTFNLLPTPIAGYAAPVLLSCSSPAPGATCVISNGSIVPTASASDAVALATTSQYTVVGYSSLGGRGMLILLAGGSVWLVLRKRRSSHGLFKSGLAVLLVSAASLTLSGCGNLNPAQNNNYTGPGTYPFTITATDGILTHTISYNLTVTKQ